MFKQINVYLRKIRENRVSNFLGQKTQEKSSDTEVSELFVLAEKEGFEPSDKGSKTVAALRHIIFRCHFHCHF